MIHFSQWRVIDSHWVNTLFEYRLDGKSFPQPCFQGTLADYFYIYGIDIPDYVSYCLGDLEFYSFKFRHHGGLIELFINEKN